jgi:hypothetical protein
MGHIKSAKEFELEFERENAIRIGRNKGRLEIIRALFKHNMLMDKIIKDAKVTKEEILLAQALENHKG